MSRKLAREWAFKILYAIDTGQNTIEEAAEIVISKPLNEDDEKFLYDEVRGTQKYLEEVDKTIEKYSEGWKIERLPSTDRNILRLAVYEMLYCKEIPISVSINEAVELSKKYCDEQSYKFINGVLGSIAKNEKTLSF